MNCGLWDRIKMDWWEITNLGFIGYVHFAFDWCKYLLGISTYRPDIFAYSEIDMDLDINDTPKQNK
jgi:hypothetical protein